MLVFFQADKMGLRGEKQNCEKFLKSEIFCYSNYIITLYF